MPVITEAEIREKIRQPQPGMKISLPKGAQLSPSAQDFIKQWKMEVVGEDAGHAHLPPAADEAEWNKPSVFPVNFEGDIPICITCGSTLRKKPEHMTQLDATYYAPKSHLRIKLRGQLDKLQSMCLLIGSIAISSGNPDIATYLGELAAYCREMLSAEYNERPVAPLLIAGFDEAAMRKTTHDPQEFIGIPHLTPDIQDDPLLLWLNFLRCEARVTEITALETFGSDDNVQSFGLITALNRMSSAAYLLELLIKKALSA